MSSTIAAPLDWVEAVSEICIFHRRRTVAFRNSWTTTGLLSQAEREELEALVELSEQLALVRGEALQILGKRL